MSAELTSYEEVPYESKPIYRTHPDGMAAVATVFGIEPPPIRRCRVLELGCAGGGNLLSMALGLPDSRFVGIDLSPSQIREGQQAVDALGLANVELKAGSILDVGSDFGQFDYIICHGVYSWVPPAVQDKILDICSKNLNRNGIVYISYNCYPGWHARGMIREMMCYHTRNITEPLARARAARSLLAFLARMTGQTTSYGTLLNQEADLWNKVTDSYLVHEQLEDHNHPVYFHQFVERAAGHSLQFLAEAEFSPLDADPPAEVRDGFGQWAENVVEWEQYLDFLRNRTFRRTLLCHTHHTVNRAPSPDVVKKMHAATLARPLSEKPDIHTAAVEKFEAPDGASIATNNPIVKAALVTLFELWPRAASFGHLWESVRSRLADVPVSSLPEGAGDPGTLAEALLRCFLSNVVELHVRPPEFVVTVSERPLASPLARFQVTHGATRISSLLHRPLEISDVDRFVLGQLDGTRDRPALRAILKDLVAREVLVLRKNDQPIKEPAHVDEYLDASLDQSLRRIAASALLVA
jgi:methyltransferase-like protein/2-polyprenyl-3-methyl-5-hydroxy-6-metoxy-1,4-benzoquinol methylase